MAARATAYLASASQLFLVDLVVGETVYVLESFYRAPRAQIASSIRSLLAYGAIVTVDPALLLRAIEIYEQDRLYFAEAYLVACAERTGIGVIASFDQSIGRVTTVKRVEP
jgi:predicted nucleic-acid-binding protein